MWNEIQLWAGFALCVVGIAVFLKWIVVGARETVVINEDGTEDGTECEVA